MNTKHRIIVINPTNINYDNDSITNYIRGLLKYNKFYDVSFYGTSKAATQNYNLENPIDKNSFCKFYPIFNFPKSRIYNFLPKTLHYVIEFYKAKSKIIQNNSILSLHGCAWALPFLYPSKLSPCILTIHGCSRFNRIAFKSKFKVIIYDLIEKLALRKIDKVILVSMDGFNFYVNKYPKIKHKCVYLPTFFDNELFFPHKNRQIIRKRWGVRTDDIVLTYIGRLVEEKGLNLLLGAFKIAKVNFKNAKLIIVGEGNYKNQLKKIIIRKKIGDVTFLGELAHSSIPEILHCADLFILPSKFEGTPLAALESVACGVPVISFRVSDMDKIVIPDQTGYLVNEHSEEGLANVIMKGVKTLVKTERTSFTAVVRKYAASNLVPKILKIYSKTCS